MLGPPWLCAIPKLLDILSREHPVSPVFASNPNTARGSADGLRLDSQFFSYLMRPVYDCHLNHRIILSCLTKWYIMMYIYSNEEIETPFRNQSA